MQMAVFLLEHQVMVAVLLVITILIFTIVSITGKCTQKLMITEKGIGEVVIHMAVVLPVIPLMEKCKVVKIILQ